MRYYIYALTLLLPLFSFCNKKQIKESPESHISPIVLHETPSLGREIQQVMIGDSITGDFNGDNKVNSAVLEIIEEGIFQEKAWTLAIKFPNSDIPPIKFQCDRDYSILINEGDLNNIPGDEITIYSPPLNGCTYHMTTYSFIDGKWEIIIPTFLIPTFCDELSHEDLQNRIFRENNNIFYYETNPETGDLIKVNIEQ